MISIAYIILMVMSLALSVYWAEEEVWSRTISFFALFLVNLTLFAIEEVRD